MENKNSTQSSASGNNTPDMSSTVSDLHDEGVDIVDGGSSEQEEERVGTTQIADENPQVESKPEPKKESPSIPEPLRHLPPEAVQQVPFPAQQKQPLNSESASHQAAERRSEAQNEINRELGSKQGAGDRSQLIAAQNDPSIKPLRTFKSDAEEAVKHQNVSTAQMVIAEQKKRESQAPIQQEAKSGSKKGVTLFVISLLLVGTAGAFYLLATPQSDQREFIPPELKIETIIPYQRAETLTLKEKSDLLEGIGETLSAAEVSPGETFALVPVSSVTSTQAISIRSILTETNAPDMLKRSLGEKYMIGAYAGENKASFIILKNTYFQNAFAGMLEWEKDMRNDLIPLIRVSRASETRNPVNTDVFEDLVVSNIDVRSLKNQEGEDVLLYAFTDKDTIVIATEAEALKKIIERLLAVRVVQ